MVTVEPSSTLSPAGGDSSNTIPCGVSLLGKVFTATSKPALVSTACASAWLLPMTVGTSAFEDPRVRANTSTAASARRISVRIARRPGVKNPSRSGGSSGGGGGGVPAAAATAAWEAVSPSAAPDGSVSAASRASRNSSAEA